MVHLTDLLLPLACLACGFSILRAGISPIESPTLPQGAGDSDSSAPRVVMVDPAPGVRSQLSEIRVTFSEPVTGVMADDLLINELPATGVAGSTDGTAYTFTFTPPGFGPVEIRWSPLLAIRDLDEPPSGFFAGDAEAAWSYDLRDPSGPKLAVVRPMPGSVLRSLGEVELWFNRPVKGLAAGDLLLNGVAADRLTGVGAGPYRFHFPQPAAPGPALLIWSADHGIEADDEDAHAFEAGSWTYSVDPSVAVPDVIINEFLAENLRGKTDEDKDPEDWIELWNRGTQSIDLAGWALSAGSDPEDEWPLPPVVLPRNRFLLIWASGKDRAATGPKRELHTHFKLNPNGGRLRLLGPELPRPTVDAVEFGRQGPDFSYGRVPLDGQTVWRHLTPPTPGSANGASTLTNATDEVHFSVERGHFDRPFSLSLACETPHATILYTTNGSPPLGSDGLIYSGPLLINASQVIRAAATAPQHIPSRARTHTYLFGLPASQRTLPAISLVTASSNLFGPTGIMEFSPRNTTKHGPAWERPVSVEYIRPEDNGGFQVDAGVRLHGGDYIRSRYNYETNRLPENKYAFRLYFRGEYGAGRLEYPLFPHTSLASFDNVVLRSGMNDPSNPFLKDEFVRQLAADMGQPASHGDFAHLFINGRYAGYYNPTERLDGEFLQDYHGGEAYELIAQQGGVREGDRLAWVELMRLATNNPTFTDLSARIDLTNFVDYLLPLLYVDADDWPHNNWRAAREAKPGARWRFYVWDAEWSFGQPAGRQPDTAAGNTLNRKLIQLGTKWEIPRLFNALLPSREFQYLVADRAQRAFFNDGPLTDARIRARYEETKTRLRALETIPDFDDQMISNWIDRRRPAMLSHLGAVGLNRSTNAPGFSPFGGAVPAGFLLHLTNLTGTIYFTTDGSDPRVAFTDRINSAAQPYTAPLAITGRLHLRARSLEGTTNWSALTEAHFEAESGGTPLRLTEIMYHPPGGDAFEFVELLNAGGTPVDLAGFQFEGLNFRFPVAFPPLGGGQHLILANDDDPAAFATRYPGVSVAGYFGGSLSNGGERLALLDRDGRVVEAVTYGDRGAWPTSPDGEGPSLERRHLAGDSRAAESWQASSARGGTPGEANPTQAVPIVRLEEIAAGRDQEAEWIELHNAGSETIRLDDWSLTDDPELPARFVFPEGTEIAGGGYLVVRCGLPADAPGLNAPFGLDGGGETVLLFDARKEIVDSLMYGPQAVGFTSARFGPDGAWKLGIPTPGTVNVAADTTGPASVVLNEFLADSDSGDDWIEFHNPTDRPAVLTGGFLGLSERRFRIAVPAFVAPGGFALFRADEGAGGSHLDFKLPAGGGTLIWADPAGTIVDSIAYGPQRPMESTGRIPDGTGGWISLAGSPSPGATNYLAAPGQVLQLNEFMAANSAATLAPDGLPADWLELRNGGTNSIPLTGFTVQVDGSPAWRFPSGAELPAGGHLLLWATSRALGAAPNLGRELPDSGAAVVLADERDRVLDRVTFGFQLPNQSVGRVVEGWRLLVAPTPGEANGAAAPLGDSRALRFNEWLAAPALGEDWLELHNGNAAPVNLEGHVLTDDPSISGRSRLVVAPLSFVPAGGFVRFSEDKTLSGGGNRLPFGLDTLGETLLLIAPDGTLLDQLAYLVQMPGVSEGRFPDGTSRITRLTWLSPAASNGNAELDLDQDSIPDEWEFRHGFDPDDGSDGALDPDLDGRSNAQEFADGTDPRQPNALPLVVEATYAGSRVTLRFVAIAGQSYRVEILSGDLRSNEWSPLAEVPAEVSTRSVTIPHDTAESTSVTHWYRVVPLDPG